MGSQSVSYVAGDHPLLSNGRRASESAVLIPPAHTRDDQDGSFSGSVTPSTSSPVRTMSKSRRTGANIIASALAMTRSHTRPETPNGDSSSSSHCQGDSPVTTDDQSSGTNSLTPTSKSHGKPLPKISLTEHSEDDYGGSSPEHHVKSKKSSDSGLRAMREKVCGFWLILTFFLFLTYGNYHYYCSHYQLASFILLWNVISSLKLILHVALISH